MSSYLDSLFGLSSQSIFLTGASSGIGQHWAKTLCAANCRHLALAARRTDKLEQIAQELRKQYPNTKICTVTLDVGQGIEQIQKALDLAEKELGGVTFNVIINNAGVGPSGAFLEGKQQTFDETMQINVRGPFLLGQEAAKRMIKNNIKNGSIINVASMLGLRIGLNNSIYATTKAALIHLTKSMAAELLLKGIRVNCICPGYYASEMTNDFYASANGKKYLQTKIPSKRLGELEELDGPLLLLASNASSNMSGAVVLVDGGHLNSSL